MCRPNPVNSIKLSRGDYINVRAYAHPHLKQHTGKCLHAQLSNMLLDGVFCIISRCWASACKQESCLTNGGVDEDAAEIAAEEEARGERVVSGPDAHPVIGGDRSQRVLARAIPPLGRQIQRLAQRLLQRLVLLRALHQLLELPHCACSIKQVRIASNPRGSPFSLHGARTARTQSRPQSNGDDIDTKARHLKS